MHMVIKNRIYTGWKRGYWFNWNCIFGLIGIIFFSGCQTIPPDLSKTFPKETTQYIYDFPIQLGLEWWYQGKILEDGREQSYINHSTVKELERFGGGTYKLVVATANLHNKGPKEHRSRIDKSGFISLGSDSEEPLERHFVPYPFLQFPIRLGRPIVDFDKRDLDLGRDLDRDWENERVDMLMQRIPVKKESVTVPAGTYPDALLIETHMILEIHLSAKKKTFPVLLTTKTWQVRDTGVVKSEFRAEAFRSEGGLGADRDQTFLEELVGVRSNAKLE